MRDNHTREIDGSTWTVSEFSATEGLRVLAVLTKLCGGAVAKAIESLPDEGSVLDNLNTGMLAGAVADLANRLDQDEVVRLIKRLVANTRMTDEAGKYVDCGGAGFDLVFRGRYLTLFKLVGFVLEVNYKLPLSDLLAAASPVGGQGQAA